MSVVKVAAEQRQGGISGFTQRHPLLTAGIALTGGIAAADAGTKAFSAIKDFGAKKSFRSGLGVIAKNNDALKTVGKEAYKGLKEGALYGGILSAVEPTILHGALRKKENT